jgi:hypothetical protein
MPIGQPCRVYPGRECWDCFDAYKEIIHRSATGATVHNLNNTLIGVAGGCHNRDRVIYEAQISKFMRILRGHKP